ncbi:MAG: beta-galactosidase [Alistipes sp.]|nr:beta-galactosidase [Alistipes sp.]
MKKICLLAIVLIASCMAAFAQWQPAGDKIKTPWATEIDPANPLPEYPRPIMERERWANLNGLWDYAIRPAGEAEPTNWDGKILVPFAVESSLSGVQKPLGGDNELWYSRTFDVPSAWRGNSVMLHFGAVDWKADVWLNGIRIGSHTGGYAPFCFDITPYMTTGSQSLTVRVWDPTNDGEQPRGKQVERPEGIWYTPVSGIWQTVWIEPVATKHITSLKTVADIDNARLTVEAQSTATVSPADIVEVTLSTEGRRIASARGAAGQPLDLHVAEMKLWSPESPFLYDMEVILSSGGKVVDRVTSYAAMRKVSTKKDENGIVRLQLNNRDYFQFGPLDQGWWPDGLYTAPTDEALAYDIVKTKELGYNMIRKHVKVEPARWYTHCDRLGVLVWQDMPSGGPSPQWQMRKHFDGSEAQRSPESEANYRKEWREIMDFLQPNPSIVVWVPFNEAWGQFKSSEMAAWTKAHDPSRLVNPASGGNHYYAGDMLDLHNYPGPAMFLYDAGRANVLGEYGGIGLPLEGHLWQTDRNWGYIQFKDSKEVTDEYEKYANELQRLIRAGFTAAVYTQTTDVEGEVNGLMTYDRKVVKVEAERIRRINQAICNSLSD